MISRINSDRWNKRGLKVEGKFRGFFKYSVPLSPRLTL